MKLNVMAGIVIGTCAAYVLVGALTELTREQVPQQSAQEYKEATALAPLAVANDMKLKSGKAKYRYKTDNPQDAEQTWVLAGETPTAYSSFEQISTVRMRGRKSGNPDSFDHQFSLKPSGITAEGRVYKGRFFPWDNLQESRFLSSGSEHKYACGIFKAKLVTDKTTGSNRMVFTYAVTSASRLGELGETNHFYEMKDELKEMGKTNGVIDAEYAMTLNNLEQHDVAGQTSFRAGVNGGTGKVVKNPAPATR